MWTQRKAAAAAAAVAEAAAAAAASAAAVGAAVASFARTRVSRFPASCLQTPWYSGTEASIQKISDYFFFRYISNLRFPGRKEKLLRDPRNCVGHRRGTLVLLSEEFLLLTTTTAFPFFSHNYFPKRRRRRERNGEKTCTTRQQQQQKVRACVFVFLRSHALMKDSLAHTTSEISSLSPPFFQLLQITSVIPYSSIQPATVVCKMEAQLKYLHITYTFGADLYAHPVLINKISIGAQSEAY